MLPSLGHLFKSPACSYLLFVFLVKTNNRYNVPLPTLGKTPMLYSCCTASFINLELNAEIPLTALIYMFSRCVCHFPESELLLLDKRCPRWPSLTNHQLNNRTALDGIKVGCIKLLNRPGIRDGNGAAYRVQAGVWLSLSKLQGVKLPVLFTAVSPQCSTAPDSY